MLMPFSDICVILIIFIAASKKSIELMAHTYSYLYKLPTTGLRFLQFMDPGVDLIWHYLNFKAILENKSRCF